MNGKENAISPKVILDPSTHLVLAAGGRRTSSSGAFNLQGRIDPRL
jgi:hypothetical protein